MKQLAICYDEGFGIEVNKEVAFEYYKKANELDSSVASYLYNKGIKYQNSNNNKKNNTNNKNVTREYNNNSENKTITRNINYRH